MASKTKKRRSRAKPNADPISSAARSLGGRGGGGKESPYVTARTRQAEIQTARVEQIIRKEARDLLEAQEVERLLVAMTLAFRARLRNVHKQMKAQFRGLSPKVYTAIETMHDDALKQISMDIIKLGEQPEEDDED